MVIDHQDNTYVRQYPIMPRVTQGSEGVTLPAEAMLWSHLSLALLQRTGFGGAYANRKRLLDLNTHPFCSLTASWA